MCNYGSSCKLPTNADLRRFNWWRKGSAENPSPTPLFSLSLSPSLAHSIRYPWWWICLFFLADRGEGVEVGNIHKMCQTRISRRCPVDDGNNEPSGLINLAANGNEVSRCSPQRLIITCEDDTSSRVIATDWKFHGQRKSWIIKPAADWCLVIKSHYKHYTWANKFLFGC